MIFHQKNVRFSIKSASVYNDHQKFTTLSIESSQFLLYRRTLSMEILMKLTTTIRCIFDGQSLGCICQLNNLKKHFFSVIAKQIRLEAASFMQMEYPSEFKWKKQRKKIDIRNSVQFKKWSIQYR